MIPALTSLNPVALLVVSILGFLLGALWYSPVLFVKPWLEEMRLTPDMVAQRSGRMRLNMAAALVCTVISTVTLAALVASHHSPTALKGAELGLLVGAGLVAAREGTNALFEGRSLRLFLVVSGHDVALCVLQGAILAVWR